MSNLTPEGILITVVLAGIVGVIQPRILFAIVAGTGIGVGIGWFLFGVPFP